MPYKADFFQKDLRRIFLTGFALAFIQYSPLAMAQQSGPAPRVPTEIFAQIPDVSALQLSPDARHVAFFLNRDGRRYLGIQPVNPEEGGGILLPPGENLEFNWLKWANNERLLAAYNFDFLRRDFFDKTTETRLVSVSVDGQDIINMAEPKKIKGRGSNLKVAEAYAQIQDDVIDYLPDDPDHILLVLNEDQDFRSGFTIRKVNVNTGKYTTLERKGWMTDWRTDRNSEPRLAWGYNLVTNNQTPMMYYREPGADDWTEISNTPVHGNFTFVDFFDDSRFCYVSAYSASDKRGLYKYDMLGHEIVEPVFLHEKYDIEGILLHPITQRIAGVSYIADKEKFVWFDEELAGHQETIDNLLKDYENRITNITEDGKKLIIRSSSPTDPGVYYLFDLEKRRLDEVALVSNDIDPATLAPVQAITYEARDGLEIEAFLTVPLGMEAKNLPTVIMPHGGPWARSYKSYHYRAQFLANRGYAVLQPNFRGSTGYGRKFRAAGNNEWGLLMQDDVTDATQWMIDQGIAAPGRICIIGASYGGYASLMGVVKEPDLYQCAASINGVSDLIRLISSDRNNVGFADWIEAIGDPGGDRQVLKETSPARHADKIKAAVLLIAAKDDTRVDYDHSKSMRNALQDEDKDVEYVAIDHGGHGLQTAESRLAVLTALESFLDRHIGQGKAKKSASR